MSCTERPGFQKFSATLGVSELQFITFRQYSSSLTLICRPVSTMYWQLVFCCVGIVYIVVGI